MFSAPANIVPSEHTVEVLSNHYLLHHLNWSSAWVCCPTTPQERTLGYDASLQNGKIVVIQYKRIRRSSKALSIDLDANQHQVLRTNFPAANRAYVFYAFSTYRTYRHLNADYLSAGGPFFFEKMKFVNVHSLPGNCTSLRLGKNGLQPLIDRVAQPAIPSLNGQELTCGILKCDIGLGFSEFKALTQTQSSFTIGDSIPHLAILLLRHVTPS